jgi:hypothetical protein
MIPLGIKNKPTPNNIEKITDLKQKTAHTNRQ